MDRFNTIIITTQSVQEWQYHHVDSRDYIATADVRRLSNNVSAIFKRFSVDIADRVGRYTRL